jgi:hypothetical protein
MKAQMRTHRGRRHPGRFGKVASPMPPYLFAGSDSTQARLLGKLTWRAFQDRHKFIRSHDLPMG